MDNPSAGNPSDEERPDAEQERRKKWLRSFGPTDSSIEGGLFPARLGRGMVGLEDYSSIELSDEPADVPGLTEETRRKFHELYARHKRNK